MPVHIVSSKNIIALSLNHNCKNKRADAALFFFCCCSLHFGLASHIYVAVSNHIDPKHDSAIDVYCLSIVQKAT